MTPKELLLLVNEGEGATVEFKKTTTQLHAAFETICAFLNGKGGVVLVGVTDERKIIGQDVSDHTKQEIANHIAKLEPSAQTQIEIEYIVVEKNKYVIVITVNQGNHFPYIYDGRAFLRNQSTTTRMSQHRYEQLIVERGQLNHSWEKLFADKKYTIDSLDHQEIYRTIEQGVRFNRIPSEALQDSTEDALIRL